LSTLAVDLGGTHLRVALVDESGSVEGARRVDTPVVPGDDFLDLLRSTAAGGATTAVVGVPGRVDYRLGRLEHAPNLSAAWRDQLREDAIGERLGLPVALANDADLAAVGEAWFGAGRGHADVAYLTISTGVGAGVVTGGLLCHGRRSMAEVGHTVIDRVALAAWLPATVEALGSGTALDRLAQAAGLGSDASEVVARAQQGDEAAAALVADVVGAAALGAVSLAHLFAPDILVLGGGLGRQADLVVEPIRRALVEHGPVGLPRPIEVVTAGLGDQAGLAGAGAWGRAFLPQAAGR
jgi:glucokinase